MKIFIIVYFIVYGSMNCYLLRMCQSGLNLDGKMRFTMIALATFMVLCPIFIRLLDKHQADFIAVLLAYPVYLWMAFVLLFITTHLCLTLYSCVIKGISTILSYNVNALALSKQSIVIVAVIASLIIIVYGYINAMNIQTNKIVIKTPKVPANAKTIRVVHISDLHIGLIIRGKRLKKVIAAIKQAKPDILLSTGDFVDTSITDLQNVINMFKAIKPRYGSFAVTGNHEFYAGIEKSVQFTRDAGFKVLRQSAITVEGLINIAGVDDAAGKKFNVAHRDLSPDMLMKLPQDKFTILLNHRPVVNTKLSGLVDLQLSGHTHKGQIFPFSLITHIIYPVTEGKLTDVSGTKLYVSPGTGTWGPPVRFLSTSCITIIELKTAID